MLVFVTDCCIVCKWRTILSMCSSVSSWCNFKVLGFSCGIDVLFLINQHWQSDYLRGNVACTGHINIHCRGVEARFKWCVRIKVNILPSNAPKELSLMSRIFQFENYILGGGPSQFGIEKQSWSFRKKSFLDIIDSAYTAGSSVEASIATSHVHYVVCSHVQH